MQEEKKQEDPHVLPISMIAVGIITVGRACLAKSGQDLLGVIITAPLGFIAAYFTYLAIKKWGEK